LGTAQGSLLASTNYGESWRLVHWFPGAILTIKIQPQTGFMWVYTKERKMFRSTDNGENWMELTQNINSLAYEATLVTNIVFHPDSPQIVYLATSFGLIKSTNNGSSWSLVHTPIPPKSLPIGGMAISNQPYCNASGGRLPGL